MLSKLAKSQGPKALAKSVYGLCERFRPAIPAGAKGWGAKGKLKLGELGNTRLQAAWNTHGEAAFAFAVLEEIESDNALLIPSLLKDRLAHWLAEPGAQKLTG